MTPEIFELAKEKFSAKFVPELAKEHLEIKPQQKAQKISIGALASSIADMKNSAAGLDGMKITMLKQMILVKEFRIALHKFVNHCISGEASLVVGYVINADILLATFKDHFKHDDVRPVCIGNALRRVTERVVLPYAKSRALDAFGPWQFGAGISNGVDKAIHTTTHFVRAAHDLSVPTLVRTRDQKNAFNEVDRNVIMEGVDKYMPQMANYVRWLFKSGAPQVFGEVGRITSKAGVPQGAPLSSLLFCFVPAKIWKELRAKTKIDDVKIEWKRVLTALYIDDTCVAGPPDMVNAIYSEMERIGRKYGFVVAAHKDQQFMAGVPPTTDPNAKLGLNFLGTYISAIPPSIDDEPCPELQKIVDRYVAAAQRLRLVNSSQDKMMMLRMCHTSMVPLNHLARTTPPEALLNVVKCMDDTVTKLVAEMVSENPKETVESFRSSHPYVRNQMGWALHDGGMGLRAAANHIFAAFIASKSATFAHTEEAMRELKMGVHTLGHSFKRIEDKILKFALQSFNKLADLWNKNNRQVSDKAKKAPAAAGKGKGKATKGKRQVTFTPAPDSAEKAAIEPLTIASLAQPA
jgi:hypothetical protein